MMNRLPRALFTVSYAGLWGQAQLSAAESIRRAAVLGYDGVLLMAKPPHITIAAVSEHELREIEEAISETGMKIAGLAAYTDFTLPSPGEIPIIDLQLAYVRECCRITSRLGGDLVRVFTGYRYDNRSETDSWALIVRALKACGEFASEYGLHIAVQNHHDMAVGTGEMNLLLDEVDHERVRAGFDAWSPFLRGEEIDAGAAAMGGRTAMTILANYRKYPRYSYHPETVNYARLSPDSVRAVPIDAGEIDYPSFLKALTDNGFSGWCVYEMCSPLAGGGSLENLDRHASRFIEFMEKLS